MLGVQHGVLSQPCQSCSKNQFYECSKLSKVNCEVHSAIILPNLSSIFSLSQAFYNFLCAVELQEAYSSSRNKISSVQISEGIIF